MTLCFTMTETCYCLWFSIEGGINDSTYDSDPKRTRRRRRRIARSRRRIPGSRTEGWSRRRIPWPRMTPRTRMISRSRTRMISRS